MDIRFYNTRTRQKESFVPSDPEHIRIYSCGPTVYSAPHIGNFRAFMLADILRATLQHVGGYSTLTHVMNITDVGHLTDDGDQGEDKMEKGARKSGLNVREVAQTYEQAFHECLDAFAIAPFSAFPRATDYILEQIQMVHQLRDKGYTYIIPGDGIYMDTRQVDDYGKLAQLDIEGLCSAYREDGDMIVSEKKKCLTDFALWKFSPTGERRAMEWVFDGSRAGHLIEHPDTAGRPQDYSDRDIPSVAEDELTTEELATRGFPGWHIECSAMANALLGKDIDIHTGGVDHIPVHHTNEIAQSECALGCTQWVKYRLHQQFLNVDGGKMSKSKGHDLSVPAILERGYDPLDVRYFYLTAHYRSFLDFTWDALERAAATRNNIIKKIAAYLSDHTGPLPRTTGELYTACQQAMADDLDTVKVLTLLHSALADPRLQDIADIYHLDDEILKLSLCAGVVACELANTQDAPAKITTLADERVRAKQAKDWDRADTLRDQIRSEGRHIEDTPGGYKLTPIV